MVGPVYGITTPSVTGVHVIGEITQDRAIHVFFEDRRDLWFAPDVLEFIDHGAGAVATLKGVSTHWTRAEDGTWIEKPSGQRITRLFERIAELFKRMF